MSALQPTLDTSTPSAIRSNWLRCWRTLEIRDGTSGVFTFGVGQDQKDSTQQIAQAGQGGLGLPDRDYYLLDTPRQKKIRDRLRRAHDARCSSSPAIRPRRPPPRPQTVMSIETALAQGSMSRTDRRDPAKRYHIMTLADFEKLTPDFQWPSYLQGSGWAHFRR